MHVKYLLLVQLNLVIESIVASYPLLGLKIN